MCPCKDGDGLSCYLELAIVGRLQAPFFLTRYVTRAQKHHAVIPKGYAWCQKKHIS